MWILTIMKIKPEHYELLKQAIEQVQSEHPDLTVEYYESIGRSAKRYRWDCLWFAGRKGYIKIGDGKGIDGVPIYEYCNDSHIDTALRKITGTT